MRRANINDISDLQRVYTEAYEYAENVGGIDWPEVFPEDYLASLIETKQLHCFEQPSGLVAAVMLSETPYPEKVWPDGSEQHLYIGRLATADAVRHSGYVPKVVLPEVEFIARSKAMIGLRLNCLAQNQSLIDFYNDVGFTSQGTAETFSEFVGRQVETTLLEKPLS